MPATRTVPRAMETLPTTAYLALNTPTYQDPPASVNLATSGMEMDNASPVTQPAQLAMERTSISVPDALLEASPP